MIFKRKECEDSIKIMQINKILEEGDINAEENCN